MMKRVDAGLPPTEEGLVDPNTGVTLAVIGDGGKNASATNGSNASSSNLSGVEIAVRNGAGINGVAAEAAKKLSDKGAITDTGTQMIWHKKTLIIYNDESDKAQAQAIADALGAIHQEVMAVPIHSRPISLW